MAKKTTNRGKLLMILALVLIVGAGASYAGARYLLRLRTMSWRTDGIAASHAGDHARASDLLGRYLRRRPSDVEALECYIVSREQTELPGGQHLAETIGALRMLLQEQPDRLADRRHLLELYVKLDRRPEALDTAKTILAKHPSDVRTLELDTQVLVRLGQYRDALEMAGKWSAAAPLAVQSHLSRFALSHQLDFPAEQVIADAQKLREAHPGEARFELIQGAAYAEFGQRENAVQWLKTAARHSGSQDDFADALLAQLDHIGLNDESLALLQSWSQTSTGGKFHELLARRFWELSKWDQVADTLTTLNPADPRSDANLIAFKAIALAKLKKTDEAAACRAALAGRDLPVTRAWVAVLRMLLDGAPMDDRQIVTECRAALAREPGNVCLRYFLGESELRLGETDLAIQAWQRATAENLTWSAPPTRLADLLLSKGQTQTALELACMAMRRSPNNLTTIAVFARAWEAGIEAGSLSHADDLLKLVTDVQRQLPGEPRTFTIEIQLLAEQGRKDEAIRLIRAALVAPAPPAAATDPSFLIHLSAISSRFNLGVEKECLDCCEKLLGPTAPLAYARALYQATSGSPADGLRVFDEMAKRSGKGNDMAWQLSRAQYLDITEDPAAKPAWIALGDAYPNDSTVQLAAASALAARGDWDFTQRTCLRLKALTATDGLVWQLAQARLMVERPRTNADYVEGSKLLNTIIQQYPQLPEPRVLLATALVRMNRVDGAIDQLTTASKLDPASVPAALRLAGLLQSRGDTARASAELDRIGPQLQSPQQRRRAALLLAQQGKADKAIDLLQDSRNSTAARPDLFLAILYGQRNQLDQAEAVVTQPDKPDLATIQFAAALYGSHGRRADAEQALARLDTLTLDPGIKELTRGSYCMQWADGSDAIRHFQLATQQAPTNPATWRSLADCYAGQGQISQSLAVIDEARKALPTDKALEAIQQQADLLRQTGGDPGLRSVALSVFRDPLNATPAVELLRTIVQTAPSNDMEQLASRLQRIGDHYPNYLPIQIQLANCHWSMGRATDALAVTQRAMTRFPTDAEPARLACELYAATRRWEDMLAAAQEWRKRAAANPLPADVAIAHAYLGLAQPDAALNQLKPYLPAAAAGPDVHAEVLIVYCQALMSAGRPTEAADLLWPLAGKSPRWRSVWIQIAIESPDAAQATAWLQRVADIIPAAAGDEHAYLADAWDTLGRRVNDPQLIARGTAAFDQLSADANASATALLLAAGQAERCGNPAKAEGLYRRTLAKDPDLVAAQNNLAMLIVNRGGDLKVAMTLATDAHKQQPRLTQVTDTLAQVQARSGDPKSAAATLRTAVKLEPDKAKWRVRLAQYLYDGGDIAEANTVVDSVANLDTQLDPTMLRQLDALRKKLKPTTKGQT